MARGQVRRTQIQQTKRPTVQVQSEQMVFAMDIGTRSVIGMVGIVEEGKVRIVAIEKEEHTERAMIDGQIENIEKVSALADKIKKRLEKKVHCLLYTSDAADDCHSVDLGGRRIIKKIFFKQKTAYEIILGLVGSEMCIRDSQGEAAWGEVHRGYVPALGDRRRTRAGQGRRSGTGLSLIHI